jgi:site-specific DNA recombinase
MKPIAQKQQRCAIYTRKSTEHNLDLAFNSLDAQREACEAYVKSQAHEGWQLIPGRFDDGGLSGGSLERPALQKLLDEVRARKIDVIVVYKVDRLTRSLADFAKLVELFDEHEVSFVSVTQSFNTTSSMGRLTLNVLLSFAQFEREVIGERVRDKISASKRKGIWVGGPIALGYRSVDKKIQVVPEDADFVRKIFEDYLFLGSVGELAFRLNESGLRPKPRQLSDGRILSPLRFYPSPLAYMLKNRFYIGEIEYQGEIHKGEHEAIIDRGLFEAVQNRLAEQAVERRALQSQRSAILVGLIFDDCGNIMSPSHSNKKGVRYRYYVSQAILQLRKAEAGTVARVTAPDVEALVLGAVRKKMSGALQEAQEIDSGASVRNYEIVREHIRRLIIRRSEIEIVWRLNQQNEGDKSLEESQTIPFDPNLPLKKGIVHRPALGRMEPRARETLLQAIAKARQWMEEMIRGEVQSFEEIAERENLAERYVRRLAVLAFLSPKIIRAILDETVAADFTVTSLTHALPHSWAAQEQMFGVH